MNPDTVLALADRLNRLLRNKAAELQMLESIPNHQAYENGATVNFEIRKDRLREEVALLRDLADHLTREAETRAQLEQLMAEWKSEGFDSAQYAKQLRVALATPPQEPQL